MLYLSYITWVSFSLGNSTYKVVENESFKLDSIKVLSNIYRTPGKNGNYGYEFKDVKQNSYFIDSRECKHITERSYIADTFQYSNIVFNIYTDKDGMENFSEKNGNPIRVLQFLLQDKKFIDIEDLNSSIKSNMLGLACLCSLLYPVLFTIFFKLDEYK